MADIKGCDRCGHLFTPRGPWQTLHAVTFGPMDSKGYQSRTDVTLEVCSDCMFDPTATPTPVLELAKPAWPEDGPEPEPEDDGPEDGDAKHLAHERAVQSLLGDPERA